MISLEIVSLILSILACILAIVSLIQAIVLRRRTKKESEDEFNFIANLVMYSTGNAENIAKTLEEYRKSGKWGTIEVVRQSDGKLTFNHAVKLPLETVGISGNVVARKVTDEKQP